MDMTAIRGIITVVLSFSIGFFLCGFSGGQIDTEQGYYSLTVESVTSPVKTGRNTMKMKIREGRSKTPVTKKLKIEVMPWMPAHEHGATEVPVIKENGNGDYLIERLNFSMPGKWEVYVKIRDGRSEDTAVFNVDVQ